MCGVTQPECERFAMTNPDRTEVQTLFFEGIRRMEAGDSVGAEVCFARAVQIEPDFAEGYVNLGLLLESRGESEFAEDCYALSIALNPYYFQTHLNLGALLARQKRSCEALAAYKQAIELKPDSPQCWSNLGVLYACMKREDEAERCYRTALRLDESYAATRFNLSYLLLRQGRFEEGWSCLEARNSCAPLAYGLSVPRWQGESLVGKSLLIGHEAGLGDMIQFSRYVPMLKACGAKTTLICHPPLKILLTTLAGIDNVISYEDVLPAMSWDFWTPLLSIPHYCNTRLESIPADIPYLHASPELVEKWAKILPQDRVRVGLVWKGNPKFENDADRSLPSLDVLAPLARVNGVSLIGLQKGEGENDTFSDGHPIRNLGSQLFDFADTAAVIANLDLVICVDTAVAHLAGSLGKPCWVLLPEYKTDWRWLAERTDSPWYPRVMRLFRQRNIGDWVIVVDEVAVALERFVRQA